MGWQAIGESDLLTHISGAELEQLRAAALADGQEDPVSPSIAQVTATVRGYVAACARNRLSAEPGEIPDRLLEAACDMVVAAIIARIPGYDLDEKKKARYDNALALLRDVAACRFSIEDPDSGADPGPAAELVSSEERRATREKLDGL